MASCPETGGSAASMLAPTPRTEVVTAAHMAEALQRVRDYVEPRLAAALRRARGFPRGLRPPYDTRCSPREAAAAGAGALGGAGLQRPPRRDGGLGRGGSGGGGGGNDPRLLARARRPAGDGRRRPAARPADLPPCLRRGHRDPLRRRAPAPGFRDPRGRPAAPPRGPGLPDAGPRRRPRRRSWAARPTIWRSNAAGSIRPSGWRPPSRWPGWNESTAARPDRCFGRRSNSAGIAVEADAAQLAALDRFGQAFGLCFQIADDLLDAEGDEATVGKRVGKDAGRGKLTYPTVLGIEASPGKGRGPGHGGGRRGCRTRRTSR